MVYSEDEIFDYVEKNLPKEKLEEMKKIIDANAELREEVLKIENGIAIGMKLVQYEADNSNLNFDAVREKAEQKLQELNKNQTNKNNFKKKNNIISILKQKKYFNFKLPQISAVAASLAMAYFAVNSFIRTPMQYVWVAEYAAVRSSTEEEKKPYKWNVKELGLNLRLYTSKNPDISLENNDKVFLDKYLFLKINSELDDAKVQINNKAVSVIKKGRNDHDPIIAPTNSIGVQNIFIEVLGEKLIFTYEVVAK